MGKVVGSIAAGVGLIGLAFITGGASIGPSLAFLQTGVGAAAVLSTTAIGGALLAVGASAVLSGFAGAITGKPSGAQLGRLNLTFDAEAPRKLAFGTTALATDLLYTEPNGLGQKRIDYIIALAAHKIAAVDEIRIDDKLFWSAAGGVASTYSGWATVTVRTEGTAGNAISVSGGSIWNSSNCRLTGCAYLHVSLLRQGDNNKADSPFANGISQRWTIIGKGLPVYDPRRDSTRGGSGSHRADDQATWEFTSGSTDLGNNPALQVLAVLLGWKIGGQVSVGAGYLPDRIDFADFITAANICDEAVSLAGGGSQRRYETAGLFGDDDAPGDVIASLCVHMNAELRDVNGKIGIRIATNDFSGTLPAFGPDDVLGPFNWKPFSSLTETFDVVKGNFTDPSTASLFQPAAYTPEALGSSDIPGRRVLPLDLPLIQDATRAQRVARQILRAELSRSTFTADFGPRMWAYPEGSVVSFTFPLLGLSAVPMRVVQQSIKVITDEEDAKAFCPTTLRAESATTYSWSTTDEVNPAGAVAPVSFDPMNQPVLAAITDATSELRLPAAPVFNANSSGTVTSSLPRAVRAYRYRGGVDVSATTTWSITTDGCTATVDAFGGISISAVARTGKIVVTSLRDGVELVGEFTVTKTTSAPPVSGGGGGGGGGGGTASDDTIASTSSSSYGGANAGPMTVTATTGGVVDLSAPLSFSTSGSSSNASGKWQWRVVGGSWADVASEITSSIAATAGEPDSGYIEVTQQKTGLTSGTDYEFQLLLRRNGGSGTLTFSGVASAVAS
jgi:hypothetical protein